ncbi:hypothetical protein D3C80_1904140 [compost metagenome]
MVVLSARSRISTIAINMEKVPATMAIHVIVKAVFGSSPQRRGRTKHFLLIMVGGKHNG